MGEPDAFVAKALELGLHSYGIADHAPMPPEREPFDDWRMQSSELPKYLRWIEQAKEEAGKTNLHVLAGLECDWMPGIEPWIAELRRRVKWDYLIGSVHYLGEFGSVDDSLFSGKSQTGDVAEDWRLYWQAITDMCASGLFDIVGHIDLVKIWGRRPEGDLMRYYAPALEVLEGNGMAVEINTAGWHKHCAEQYPSVPLLRELLARRIPIVIDSDAHHPHHLSRGWEQGLTLLRELAGDRLRQIEFTPPHESSQPLLAYVLS